MYSIFQISLQANNFLTLNNGHKAAINAVRLMAY
jgi:hypothetical protein